MQDEDITAGCSLLAEYLKPCPFCGGTVVIGRIGNQWESDPCYIVCDGCNMAFEITDPPNSKDAIIKAWNRRVEPIGNPDELNNFSTTDLVRELCSREGVAEYDFSSGEFYSLKSGNYREKLLGLLEMKDGPVKIIVVPGGE